MGFPFIRDLPLYRISLYPQEGASVTALRRLLQEKDAAISSLRLQASPSLNYFFITIWISLNYLLPLNKHIYIYIHTYIHIYIHPPRRGPEGGRRAASDGTQRPSSDYIYIYIYIYIYVYICVYIYIYISKRMDRRPNCARTQGAPRCAVHASAIWTGAIPSESGTLQALAPLGRQVLSRRQAGRKPAGEVGREGRL